MADMICLVAKDILRELDYFLGLIKYPLPVSRTKIEAEFYCIIEQLSKEDLYELLKKVKELGV